MTSLIKSKVLNALLVLALVLSTSPFASAMAYADNEDNQDLTNTEEAQAPTDDLEKDPDQGSAADVDSNLSEDSNESTDSSIDESPDDDGSESSTDSEGDANQETAPDPSLPEPAASLEGTAHVQNLGWIDSSIDSDTGIMTLGTTGKSLRVEAMTLKADANVEGSIKYSTHVQNIGWQDYVSDGEAAGTSGKAYRLEALKIELTETLGQKFDVYYRVHAQNIGWMSWAKNGELAGTEGFSYRLEAIQVVLVPRGENAPSVESDVSYSYTSKKDGQSSGSVGDLAYNVHVQNEGWQDWKANGETAGTSGKSLRLEGIHIKTGIEGLDVNYSTHVQNVGWQDTVSNGQMSGTSGKAYRLEAIKINLTGEKASEYDIYYRVHAQNIGWMAWAKNGEPAGSEGFAYRLEAIEIVLVPSDTEPELNTSNQDSDKCFTKATGDGLVNYSAHVQNVGWQSYVSDGETIGTTDESKRVEAFRINTNIENSGIKYRAYVQDIGWQDWVSDGVTAGTENRAKRVEAFEAELTGEAVDQYDLYYRAYVAYVGWLGWAKNGETAGTMELANRIEAFEVVAVPKGEAVPGDTEGALITAPVATYSVYAGGNWLDDVTNKGTAGTTGQNLAIEAFKATVDSDISGGIEYKLHIAQDGWLDSVSDGTVAGTEGGNQAEAVTINLTGDLAEKFDVYYRVHSDSWGWMGWAKNGEKAGTSTRGYSMQAVQIAFVLKGADAPGTIRDHYSEKAPKKSFLILMDQIAQSHGSSTNWMLLVDTAHCYTGIYQRTANGWEPYRYLLCSPGAPGTETVKGSYTVTGKGYSFENADPNPAFNYECYYYTQFYGNYLFHSVLYTRNTFNVLDGRLGQQLSHGCVRLALDDAYWIYANIPYGTRVFIY